MQEEETGKDAGQSNEPEEAESLRVKSDVKAGGADPPIIIDGG